MGRVCFGATPSLHNHNSLTAHPRHLNVAMGNCFPRLAQCRPSEMSGSFLCCSHRVCGSARPNLMPYCLGTHLPSSGLTITPGCAGRAQVHPDPRGQACMGRRLPSGGLAMALRCGVHMRTLTLRASVWAGTCPVALSPWRCAAACVRGVRVQRVPSGSFPDTKVCKRVPQHAEHYVALQPAASADHCTSSWEDSRKRYSCGGLIRNPSHSCP